MRTATPRVGLGAAIVLTLFSMLGCSTARLPHSALSNWPHRTYWKRGITFAYPRSWRVYEFEEGSSVSYSIAYVSNARLQSFREGDMGGGSPISVLPPDSALIVWSEVDPPNFRAFSSLPGKHIAVGGQPSRMSQSHPGQEWHPRHTAQVLTAAIRRVGDRNPGGHYEFQAYLSGPHLNRVRAQAMRVLYSFRSRGLE